jgi:hypothetical protein
VIVSVAVLPTPLYVAVMVAVAVEATAAVVTVNVAVTLPAATVTVAGTAAAVLVVDNATEMPPLGAALVKVTVPVEGAPPVTLAGLRDTDESAVDTDAVMASVALLLRPLLLAVIVAVAAVVTAFVATVKVAVVLPAAIVTVAGTVAAALLLDRATEMPPLGAALVKVTVPVEGAPPVTLAGLRDTDESAVDADAAMASVALLLTPLLLAVIVAVAAVVTAVVATVKVTVVLPTATVTIAGTVAAVLLLDSEIETPTGATPVNVTVPVAELPPVTLAGLSDTEAGERPAGAVTDKVVVELAAIETLS